MQTGDTRVFLSPGSQTNVSLVRAVYKLIIKKIPTREIFFMVGADGLLCAFYKRLELHRRAFALAGKPAIPASRLALVVKPTCRWFERFVNLP